MSTATLPTIPLFDLRLTPDDLTAVREALNAGRLAAGPRVEALEDVFARRLGVRHAVAVSSCTAALTLAYRAAGVGPGDEVVVPATTFVATANAAIYCGATPVVADIVGHLDAGIDPDHVRSLIGPRTAAVCAMHFAGYPASLASLRDLCDRAGVTLVEDAAHAPEADIGGRPVGTVGHLAAFSFFSNKVLSCGEGGMVVTDDPAAASEVRRLRAAEDHVLDEPRAALLLSRLQGLQEDVRRRRALVDRYRDLLRSLDGLHLPYQDHEVGSSSCYVMPVVLDDPVRRDGLRRHLRDAHHVQTSLLYPALHQFSAYVERFGPTSRPRSEWWARAEVTLPLYPHLTEAEQDRVVDAVADGLAS